ncbi:histone chaperone ASF1 [Brassica rapa]|uniref:histone chaperone ASF1 n=1 Tax=Brassica campestris TaxID=3711 RepID=UPI0004F18C10|nr:histone chaperone ASF1 [Brassica rapa]
MLPQLITFCVLCLLSLVEERKTQIMNTKNNVLVDVSPFLLFEASADSETREEGGHVGYDDKDHGNDAESTSQVTGGSADFDSVEMEEEEEEKEEELVTGEKEEEHEEEEVNSHVRWPERRENESGSVDSSSTRNDERLMRRKIEKDRMFWEACLAS